MNTIRVMTRDRIGAALLMAAAAAGLVFFLRATAEVFVPFMVALVMSLAAHPIVEWLARRKVPAWVSVVLVVVVSLIFLAVAALLVQRGIDGFIQNLPQLKARANEIWSSLSRRLGLTGQPLEHLGKEPEAVKAIAGAGGSTALTLVNLVFQVMLVILYLILLLLGRQHLSSLMHRMVNPDRAKTLMSSVVKIEREMLRYLFLRTIVSVGTAVVVGIVLTVYGVQFAGLWALLTFFAQYVPFVGPIALSVLPVLMAALQFPSLSTAAWIALWLSLWHLVVGFIVEPRIFSIGLSLNQTLLLLGLALFGWMWGIVGVLLWVPIMVALRLAAQQAPGFEAVDALLGPARQRRGHAA